MATNRRSKRVIYLIYADKRNKLVSPIGPFKTKVSAEAFDCGINHVAGNWMILEGAASGLPLTFLPGTREANDLASSIRLSKYPKYEVQDDPSNPKEFVRPFRLSK